MFSQLEALFRTNFRTIEQGDSRLVLKDNAGKDKQNAPSNPQNKNAAKHNTSDKKATSEYWEDDETRVSVHALKTILAELVRGPNIRKDFISSEFPKSEKTEDSDTPHFDGKDKARHAAQAYQDMAYRLGEEEAPTPEISGHIDRDSYHLTQAEKDKAQQFIKELETLENHHIQTIEIPWNENFLEGLEEAVTAEKQKLGLT